MSRRRHRRTGLLAGSDEVAPALRLSLTSVRFNRLLRLTLNFGRKSLDLRTSARLPIVDPPGMQDLPLPDLPPDTVARVTEIDGEHGDATRLKGMGICLGRQVQMVRAGDPLILRVLGARVGLSARLAAGIGVVAIDDE